MGMSVGTAVFRRRTVGLLMEYTVELRKTGKTAGHGNIGHGLSRAGKQKLGIDDADILNVFRHPKAGSLLKLPGQIAGTDIKSFCKAFQRKRLGIVGMYVGAHLGNLPGDGGVLALIGIQILILGLIQGPQKFRKICLQHKLIDRRRHDLRLTRHAENVVENMEAGSLVIGRQAQNGRLQLEDFQKLLKSFPHAEQIVRIHEIDDNPLQRGGVLGVYGLMGNPRRNQDNIIFFQRICDAVEGMGNPCIQRNHNLVKGIVNMRKTHVIRKGLSCVIVNVIVKIFFTIVNDDGIAFFKF